MIRDWVPDSALPGFECTVIPLPPDDDGTLVATVIRKRVTEGSRKALLYVHGFVDYFFHDHVAEALNGAGWDCYALELRRYGRSLRPGNRPNYCTSLSQYNAEISAAIAIAVDEDSHGTLVLYGHSTGGLIAALYANAGARKADMAGLVLNSPFFGFRATAWQQLKLTIAAALGRVMPWMSDPHALSPLYGESIHATHGGEWNYDLRWKPLAGFPAYFGWARAIRQGHNEVQRGLQVPCPVLVLHSDKSAGGDGHHTQDIVLDVQHMRQWSAGLGPRVQRVEIPDAIHDVMLSREPVRTRALQAMLQWLQELPAGSSLPAAGAAASAHLFPA